MAMAFTAASCSDMSSVSRNSEKSIDLAPNLPSESNEGGLSVSLENQERVPSFTKIISELQSLSTVMQTFHCRWGELQKLLNFIENALESKEKQLINLLSIQQPQDSKTIISAKESEAPSLTAKESETPLIAKEITRSDLPTLCSQEPEEKPPTSLISGNSSDSEIEMLCQTMCSRELRKYIVTHISQTSKLRQEVPAALKSSSNPAKLVLECIGRFYLQGRKAYTKNSPMIPSRKAALLILEYFLLMNHNDEVDQSVKQEAELAAVAWKNRLVIEGGMCKVGDEDVRGLLLFVACFGIPNLFRLEDLIYLLRLGGIREISEALTKSTFLRARMPEIIDCMAKKGMEVEAVDTIYTFGIEDKFPPEKYLATFLKNLKESGKKTRSEGHDSPHLMKEVNQNQLAALKSVMNCLEAHKIDPAKVIPGWKITDKITNLEKTIADLNKKIASKRRAEEQSYEISKDQEFKRSRMVEASVALPSPFSSLQEPRVADPPVYEQYSRYFDPGSSRPTTSSWPHKYSSGMGSRVGLPGAGVGAIISRGSNLVASTVSSIGFHGGVLLASREDGNHFESMELGTRTSVGTLSAVEGFPGVSRIPSFGVASRASASDLYNFADAVTEGNSARGSYRPGTTPPATSYLSSFLY